MMRRGELVDPRVSADPTEALTFEARRRAAVNVTAAHLRGVPGIPDRAALAETLGMLGLADVGEQQFRREVPA